MKLIEVKGDLFTKENMQDKNIYLAHCISRDCEMGLGLSLIHISEPTRPY